MQVHTWRLAGLRIWGSMKAALMKHLSQFRDLIFMSVLPAKRRNDGEDDDGNVAATLAVVVLMY